MPITFFNWQSGALSPGVAPYNTLSPNLIAVRDELGKRFGGTSLGGYGVRPVRGGSSPSSHGFGSAFDWRIADDAARAAAMAWLIANYEVLGVQAIHDYRGGRIWHANRYPGKDPNTWWRPSQVPNMGESWAVYLHIETDRSNWSNNTPVANRVGVSTNPPPEPPPAVGFDPSRGIWGLYPLNKAKPTLREVTSAPSKEISEYTRYLQGVLMLKASQPIKVDGDFGPATTTAVKNLQKFLGLTVVDGVVGPNTWKVIDALASR